MDIPVIIDHQPTAEGTRGGKSVSGVDDGRRERERKIEENRSRRTYVHNKYYIIYTISKKIDTSTKTIKLML